MSQMYAFYFYKKQNNSLNRNVNNIVWGNYDDLDFKHITNENLDDVIAISKSSAFDQNVNYEIDFPSSMIVIYSLCDNTFKAEENLDSWKNTKKKKFFTITLLTLNSKKQLIIYPNL